MAVEERIPQPSLGWGLDLCQNMPMSFAIRPPEHYPDSDGEGSTGFEPGFLEPCSVYPVRAMEVPNAQSHQEVCRHHYGQLVLGPDGSLHVLFCSQPRIGSGTDVRFRQTGEAYLYVQDGEDQEGGVEDGFCAFIGAYHAPYWTEAIYNSRGIVCGGVGE